MEIGIAVAASARPCLLIEDFLSASECEALRQRLEATGITATGGLYPASYRNNDRLVLDDEALAAAFYPRISEHAPAVLSDGERTYVRTRLNPRFRCCRYRDGQRFAIHRDGVYHAASGPAGHERSLLTFMIYLNGDDEFVGGRTRYYTDQSGRQLLRVRFGYELAGTWEWNGRDAESRLVPAGLYFARLESGSRHVETRVVLLR